MRHPLTRVQDAQFVFFNHFNPECSHPGCIEAATIIVFAFIPESDSHRSVASMCETHAMGQAEWLAANGFDQSPSAGGAWLNVRKTIELARDLDPSILATMMGTDDGAQTDDDD